jgi:uncharacterized protein
MKIAIIGASKSKDKYSNKAVRAYKLKHHVVFPVNPTERVIEGLTCYTNVRQIPLDIDVASFYVPPEVGAKIVEDVVELGIKKVYLNPGSESKEILDILKQNQIKTIRTCSIRKIGMNPNKL